MKLINYDGNGIKTGIYCIRNLKNNKLYVGSSKSSIGSRKRRHLLNLKNNTHYNEHLQNAWNFYGEENFSFEVLFLCKSDECSRYEAEFIKLYSSNIRKYGYNIANVENYKFAYNMSEIHNNEKSQKKINKSLVCNGLHTNERGISKPFNVYNLSGNFIKKYDSAKEYIEMHGGSRGNLSIVLSKRKLVYIEKNIILFEDDILTNDDIAYVNNKLRRKHVFLYNVDGEFINEFESVKLCADHLKCKEAEIRMCCLGKRSRIRNFITKYTKNE
jgi:hypothetical protein